MTQWRKSSHSGNSNSVDCVELARIGDTIGIRDSKAPQAGNLSVESVSFKRLVQGIKLDATRP